MRRDVSAHCKRKKGKRSRGKRGAPPKGGAQCELVDKPGSVVDDHSSATSVTTACSDLPESTAGHSSWIPIWSCSEWGLPSPRLLPAARCALTAPFHPYPIEMRRRFPFCCTFRRLAPPRRYLALCPLEPGLSSLHSSESTSDRLTDSRATLGRAVQNTQALAYNLRTFGERRLSSVLELQQALINLACL